MRDSSFWSFDDEPTVFHKTPSKQQKFLQDPRDQGGVLLETRSADRAKCSICDKELNIEIFYFEGKTRKFIHCTGCNKYLFELEKRRKDLR